ncbi:MAG: class I SAM-dependent methyltransferase [Gemmatimonadaceae bacterium]|nr:class I SAM-dependent methyltransferase [Gemmatimonadaceae bacterium]
MQDEIAHAYDRWAVSYDTDRNPTRDLDGQVLRQSALPVDGADVLELGCGTGKNTVWLASRARDVTAMDFSPGMLARARRRVIGDHVHFVKHDVREPWPVASLGIDVVVGNLVLEHVERLAPVFHEAARVLRTGGTLWLCELHPFRQWRGGQAHFTAADTGDVVHVPAYLHAVSDYVNGGLAAGLTLVHLGESLEDDVESGALPRLLSVRFLKQ